MMLVVRSFSISSLPMKIPFELRYPLQERFYPFHPFHHPYSCLDITIYKTGMLTSNVLEGASGEVEGGKK